MVRKTLGVALLLALVWAGLARAAEHLIRFDGAHHWESLTVETGEVVRWDGDFLAHPLVSDDDLHSTVRDGSTFALMFRRPGTYRYHCRAHPDAQGVIHVRGAGRLVTTYRVVRCWDSCCGHDDCCAWGGHHTCHHAWHDDCCWW